MSNPNSGRSSLLPLFVAVLCLAALAATLYFGWQKLDALTAENGRALETNQTLLTKLQETLAERDALKAQVEALQTETAELASARETLEAELAKVTATYESFADKMKAEIKKGEIRLSEFEGRIQVDLVDRILFSSGEATVTPRGQEVLARLGAVLATVEDKKIQVSGHTDDSPISDKLAETYPTNWELSVARAVNVARFLTEHAQVPPKRVVAAGHGPYQPIASNRTPEGRAKNRRIEILLIPALDKPAPKKAKVAAGRSK